MEATGLRVGSFCWQPARNQDLAARQCEIDGHIPDKEDGKGYMIGKRDNFSFPQHVKKIKRNSRLGQTDCVRHVSEDKSLSTRQERTDGNDVGNGGQCRPDRQPKGGSTWVGLIKRPAPR